MATIKSRFEYRINKKGAECFRTDSREAAVARFEKLSKGRPGVYALQARQCPVDRFGCKLCYTDGRPMWWAWQDVTPNTPCTSRKTVIN